jgi:phosphate transport system substrate-binding protein
LPGGIGYATASEVIGQKAIRPLPLAKDASQGFISPFAEGNITTVNQGAFADGSYPLTRRLFVVIKRDGRLDEQAGVAYANMILSNEGQALVEQAGFVALH